MVLHCFKVLARTVSNTAFRRNAQCRKTYLSCLSSSGDAYSCVIPVPVPICQCQLSLRGYYQTQAIFLRDCSKSFCSCRTVCRFRSLPYALYTPDAPKCRQWYLPFSNSYFQRLFGFMMHGRLLFCPLLGKKGVKNMRNSKQYHKHIECTFNAFCKILLYHAALNAYKKIRRKQQFEVSLYYLREFIFESVTTTD